MTTYREIKEKLSSGKPLSTYEKLMILIRWVRSEGPNWTLKTGHGLRPKEQQTSVLGLMILCPDFIELGAQGEWNDSDKVFQTLAFEGKRGGTAAKAFLDITDEEYNSHLNSNHWDDARKDELSYCLGKMQDLLEVYYEKEKAA